MYIYVVVYAHTCHDYDLVALQPTKGVYVSHIRAFFDLSIPTKCCKYLVAGCSGFGCCNCNSKGC